MHCKLTDVTSEQRPNRSAAHKVTTPSKGEPQALRPHHILALIPVTAARKDHVLERVRIARRQSTVIEALNGEIVAGYLDYLACMELGIEPQLTYLDTAPNDLATYIARRNIPESMDQNERACIGVLLFREQAKNSGVERMREGGREGGRKGRDETTRPSKYEEVRWREVVAAIVGVKPNRVRQAAYLLDNAPDLFEAVRDAKIPKIQEAVDLAKHRVHDATGSRSLTPEERAEVVERYVASRGFAKGKSVKSVANAVVREHTTEVMGGPAKAALYEVLVGDMMTAGARIPDNSVDASIADIPYGKLAVEAADKVGTLAARVLRDGAIIAVINGGSFCAEVISAVTAHGLTLVTLGAIHYPGAHAGHDQNVRDVRVQRPDLVPIFFFCKGEQLRAIDHLLFESDAEDSRRRKNLHAWAKDVPSQLDILRSIVDRGGRVLDPCCCSGTTGIAALMHDCTFIGIDIDPKAAAIACAELACFEKDLADKKAAETAEGKAAE